MPERVLTVLAPGPFTTVQDRGRAGRSEWGVGRSGAADRAAAALANRLVANRAGAAVLETTMGGLALLAEAPVTIAVTGAVLDAQVDGRPVPFAAPVAVAAGAVLRLGAPLAGLRTYLAVRGGVAVPPVLGSRSYDVLARLGPPPLEPGDLLPIGPAPTRWPRVDAAPVPPSGAPGPARLTGWLGPHPEALGPGAADQLAATTWTVSWDSDRTALRLSGPPLPRADQPEWPTEGVVRGAVQLPPSGLPLLMLADHPVTGGYPAVAALDDASCDRAAQLRPGDPLRLRLGPALG